jgi:hypothetical protein
MKRQLLASLSLLAGTAAAQTGTPDQACIREFAGFSEGSSLVWQQQIRAGLPGQLEGISVTLLGAAGGHVDLRIRLGDAPNASPVVFSTGLDKATANPETFFIDMRSASITLTVGQTLVMETQGNSTTVVPSLAGNYVDPATGPAQYPEPLYLNGTSWAGYRHGFTTYMIGGIALCYPNCDHSTTPPALNVLDFACFVNKFAAGQPYANCDGSTALPVLNVLDFACFINRFAAGCT